MNPRVPMYPFACSAHLTMPDGKPKFFEQFERYYESQNNAMVNWMAFVLKEEPAAKIERLSIAPIGKDECARRHMPHPDLEGGDR